MVDTKNPGDKTLSVSPTKTLTLKPRVEQGTVRQSFSHGRSKQVVVEKRGKRRLAGEVDLAPQPHPAEQEQQRRAGQINREGQGPVGPELAQESGDHLATSRLLKARV